MNRLKILLIVVIILVGSGAWLFYKKNSHPQIVTKPSGTTTSNSIEQSTTSTNSIHPVASPSKYQIRTVKTFANQAEITALLKQEAGRKIGDIKQEPDGKQVLVMDGKKVFEGYVLGQVSKATNGTVAVSSFNALHNRIDDDADIDVKTGKLTAAISSVWIIDASGAAHKITPDSMHATNPLISPDGQWVAFQSEALNASGIPQSQQVYVAPLDAGGTAGPATGLNLPSKGIIAPVMWKDGQLAVVTNDDEYTGGFALTWVQIKPGE